MTGATGSGKTTTLAAILNEINETQSVHVVTLEDPIEFVHPKLKATFNQRELGHDFNNYPNGLRAALRQAPKVILVGEMRDRATVEVALMAAETGHLVLSTLHTVDAGQSINRILGLFSLGEEKQLRIRLADTLRYVISQRLAPKENGGRQLLTEILGHNLRTRETVALGEGEHRSFYEIIEASSALRLDDVRSIDFERLRKRLHQRRNGEALRVAQGSHHPRHRFDPKGARHRHRARFRPAPRRSGQRLRLNHDMEQENDSPFIDLGDNTALVCVDHQQYQKIVVPQLIDMTYKVHLGLFEEDVILKLRTYNYDLIVIYENFKGSTLQTNPILREMVKRPDARRREHFVTLVSHKFATNDAMSAFVQSVDQIINIADLANFKPVLRRGVSQHRELYHSFTDMLKSVQSL